MANTIVAPQDLCLKMERDSALMANGIFELDMAEKQGRTFATANMVTDLSNAGEVDAAQLVSPYSKTRPGDTSCTERLTTVRYVVPECCPPALDDCTVDMDCTVGDGDAIEEMAQTLCVEDCVDGQFSLDLRNYDCTCVDLDNSFRIKFTREVRKMYSKYNRKITNKLLTLAGSSFDTSTPTATTPLSLPLFCENPTTGKVEPQHIGWEKAQYEFERMMGDVSTSPYILHASRKAKAYNMLSDIYANNTGTIGQGQTTNSIATAYYDPQLVNAVAALGLTDDSGTTVTDPVLTFFPGSLSLLEWFEYDPLREDSIALGANGRHTWAPVQISAGENLIRQKMDIGTPTIGVPFIVDAMITWSDCDNKITWKFRKYFDIWCPPAEMLCGTYNGKLLWNVTCAPYSCADICTVPHPCDN